MLILLAIFLAVAFVVPCGAPHVAIRSFFEDIVEFFVSLFVDDEDVEEYIRKVVLYTDTMLTLFLLGMFLVFGKFGCIPERGGLGVIAHVNTSVLDSKLVFEPPIATDKLGNAIIDSDGIPIQVGYGTSNNASFVSVMPNVYDPKFVCHVPTDNKRAVNPDLNLTGGVNTVTPAFPEACSSAKFPLNPNAKPFCPKTEAGLSRLVLKGKDYQAMRQVSGKKYSFDHVVGGIVRENFPRTFGYIMNKFKRCLPTRELLADALGKFGVPRQVMYDQTVFNQAVEDVISEMKSAYIDDQYHRDINKNTSDAFNFDDIAVELSSNPGYPFFKNCSKKRDCWNELVRGAISRLVEGNLHTVATQFGRAKMRLKTQDDSARSIEGYPGDAHLYVMKLLAPLNDAMARRPLVSFSGIGFKWFYGGCERLKAFFGGSLFDDGKHFYVTADATDWDHSLMPLLLRAAKDVRKALIPKEILSSNIKGFFDGEWIELKYTWETLLDLIYEDMIHQSIIDPDGNIWATSQGMKSGFGGTANDNTIIHRIVFLYSMRMCSIATGIIDADDIPSATSKQQLYGDDNLSRLARQLLMFFEQVHDGTSLYQKFALQLGVAFKKLNIYYNLHEADYLSHRLAETEAGSTVAIRDTGELLSRCMLPEDFSLKDITDPGMSKLRLQSFAILAHWNEPLRALIRYLYTQEPIASAALPDAGRLPGVLQFDPAFAELMREGMPTMERVSEIWGFPSDMTTVKQAFVESDDLITTLSSEVHKFRALSGGSLPQYAINKPYAKQENLVDYFAIGQPAFMDYNRGLHVSGTSSVKQNVSLNHYIRSRSYYAQGRSYRASNVSKTKDWQNKINCVPYDTTAMGLRGNAGGKVSEVLNTFCADVDPKHILDVGGHPGGIADMLLKRYPTATVLEMSEIPPQDVKKGFMHKVEQNRTRLTDCYGNVSNIKPTSFDASKLTGSFFDLAVLDVKRVSELEETPDGHWRFIKPMVQDVVGSGSVRKLAKTTIFVMRGLDEDCAEDFINFLVGLKRSVSICKPFMSYPWNDEFYVVIHADFQQIRKSVMASNIFQFLNDLTVRMAVWEDIRRTNLFRGLRNFFKQDPAVMARIYDAVKF